MSGVDAKRILIVRLGAIGDVLRVLPAVTRLRSARPDLELGWLVESLAYPAIVGHPAIDRFHVIDRASLRGRPGAAFSEVRRVVSEVRGFGYDVSLDFHGRLKSGVRGRMIACPVRVGFARGDSTEWNHLFTNVHVRLADRWENRVLRFLHLLAALDIDTHYDPSAVGLYLDPETRRAAAACYASIGEPGVVCYPGSSAARVRERWPEDKWVELLERLGTRGVRTTVLWGPAEKELAGRIADAAGKECALAPATSLSEMMALIACFRVFVGSDTAAMHMAWLQGVPTVTFVGPKPPRTVAPLMPIPSRVLRAQEYYVEGLKPSRQADEVVTAVPVSEAMEGVIELLAASSRETSGIGAQGS
jgi:ADP-heptose:LPS heptosyltransferase